MEKKINDFIIFCLENYKNNKNLSGKDAFLLFSKYGVFDYLENGYEMLHTQGHNYLIDDIDEYLKNRGVEISNEK